jgi:hypothetical protein
LEKNHEQKNPPSNMSYLQHLKSEAEDYDVPTTTFRDMDRFMDAVMKMTHYLDNTQLVKVLIDRGWKKEELNPNDVEKQHLKEMVMKVMFIELCSDAGIKEKHAWSFIDYWNNI